MDQECDDDGDQFSVESEADLRILDLVNEKEKKESSMN